MNFTREQVIEMAMEAGVPDLWIATISDAGFEALCRCAAVVADRALEAAAVACDEVGYEATGYGCAIAIRAMKEHQ